jgi:6-phosphogluconolactonase (cycloisomerase 2 family)
MEGSSGPGRAAGSLGAFSINRATGDLTLLDIKDSKGAGPAHLSVDPKGEFVYVANYAGGSIGVLPINQADGSLKDASFSFKDTGNVGPTKPASAPKGFSISGHDAPHAHQIEADPSGRFVLHTDLGQDRIYVWSLDRAAGKLIPASTPFVTTPGGDGPRHFAFHPNNKWLYSIQEEGSTLILWYFDTNTGALTQKQQISTLPPRFAGTNFTSEVLVSGDGNFVYAANRLADTISVFSIDQTTGQLKLVSETSTRGDYPRNIALDPPGNFLYSGNQRSDSVTVFSVNKRSGALSFTGEYLDVGSPSSIVFLH